MRDSNSPVTVPSYREALAVWTRIGLMSFGGPSGQIALMHRMLVDERKWIDDGRFLNALNFCMLLPGPEAMQLATYIGWRLHGIRGGLTSGLLFVLPGALVILALSMIYAAFGNVPAIEAIFFGIKAAVLVIVVEALLRIARRALGQPAHWLLAAASFVGIFFFGAPYPLIVLASALCGYLLSLRQPSTAPIVNVAHGIPLSRSLATAALWLSIWLAPLIAIAALFGKSHVLAQIGYFFSKLAVVTFGGAYAVLAYMGQDVASQYGWISAGEMMDGLGLAETTPGPLILVTEFVGYLAAFRHGAASPSVAMGIIGAAVTLWATFAPCFLWVFTGAPYIEWLNAQPKLKGALASVTAAVVGVILNLAIWFALHVFFARVSLSHIGALQLWTPDLATLDWRVVLLAVASAYLLLLRHWNIVLVLAIAAAASLAIRLLGV